MNSELIQFLHRREAIIADHAWRDRDPAGQLAALREVSEQISAWAAKNDKQIDGRLRHYLANASFAKALAHLDSATE